MASLVGIQSSNFFRSRLLGLTSKEQIDAFIAQYDTELKLLVREIVELTGNFRNLSREEAWRLTQMERKEYADWIENRLKVIEKSQGKLPIW